MLWFVLLIIAGAALIFGAGLSLLSAALPSYGGASANFGASALLALVLALVGSACFVGAGFMLP